MNTVPSSSTPDPAMADELQRSAGRTLTDPNPGSLPARDLPMSEASDPSAEQTSPSHETPTAPTTYSIIAKGPEPSTTRTLTAPDAAHIPTPVPSRAYESEHSASLQFTGPDSPEARTSALDHSNGTVAGWIAEHIFPEQDVPNTAAHVPALGRGSDVAARTFIPEDAPRTPGVNSSTAKAYRPSPDRTLTDPDLTPSTIDTVMYSPTYPPMTTFDVFREHRNVTPSPTPKRRRVTSPANTGTPMTAETNVTAPVTDEDMTEDEDWEALGAAALRARSQNLGPSTENPSRAKASSALNLNNFDLPPPAILNYLDLLPPAMAAPNPAPNPAAMAPPQTPPIFPPPLDLSREHVDGGNKQETLTHLTEQDLTNAKWHLARHLIQMKGIIAVIVDQVGLFHQSMGDTGLRHMLLSDAKRMWTLLTNDMIATLDDMVQQICTVEIHIRNLTSLGALVSTANITVNDMKRWTLRDVARDEWVAVLNNIGYMPNISDGSNWAAFWGKLLDMAWIMTRRHVGASKGNWVDWTFSSAGRMRMKLDIEPLLAEGKAALQEIQN